MKCAWIEEHRGLFSVRACCQVLNVSSSGYYRQRSAPASPRESHQKVVDAAVAKVHADSHQIYGSRKVAAELKLGPGEISATRNTVVASMRLKCPTFMCQPQ